MTSIRGINVQGNGIGEVEIATRISNLETVILLEEQERERRILNDRIVFSNELSAKNSIKWAREREIVEQLRREADIVGEAFKKKLAALVSALIIAYWTSHPSLRQSGEILSELTADMKVLTSRAFDKTLSATEGFLHKAGDYALRAAEFFGTKAVVLGEAALQHGEILSAKAADKVQVLGEAALQQGEILSAKAAVKAQEFRVAAVEQSHIVGARAVELGDKAIAGAKSLGHQLSAAAVEQAHQLGDAAQIAGTRAIEKTEEMMQTRTREVEEVFEEVDLDFVEDIKYTLTWEQLTTLEELERNHRMKERLAIEGFLLALQTSDLIKNVEGYHAPEPNRWYATAVLEEFERKRRFLEDRVDQTAIRNAHTIAYFVFTYSNMKSRQPTIQIPTVTEIIIPTITETVTKKKEVLIVAPPAASVTARAAM